MDAKSDSSVIPGSSNPSRPSMQRAIRNANGSEVTRVHYDAIHTSCRHIVSTILLPLTANASTRSKKSGRGSPGTKTFYVTHHCTEWTRAILELEKLQPVLAFCAEHWKAEYILQSVLTNMKEVDDQVGDTSAGLDISGVQINDGPAIEDERRGKRSRMPKTPPKNGGTASEQPVVDLIHCKFSFIASLPSISLIYYL